jgi:hypothetical protein
MKARVFAALFAAALVAGTGTAGAAARTQQTADFTGAASSHAVRITVGNIEVTVGGGQSNAAYQRVQGSTVTIRNTRADAHSNGLVIPGVIDSHVACVPPKLTDSLVAIATPPELQPVLSARLGAADCAISVRDLPTAGHSAGEIDASITLTQSIVGDVSAVNSVLGTVQDQLGSLPPDVRAQASNVIDAIKAKLASDPVLDIKVAPNSGTVTSTADGIESASPGTAVTLSLLGGVIQIDIAVADSAAKIVDGKPEATSKVSLVHIKALDITTPDPNDALIDETITAPQSLSVLQGTPLETSIATERGTTSTLCDGPVKGYTACASGTADAVSLRMLASPLPTIGIDLVHTQALAATKTSTQTSTSSPSLPRTGAAAGATVLGGLALAGGALAVRRFVTR